MHPLLVRDGQSIPYAACLGLFVMMAAAAAAAASSSTLKETSATSTLGNFNSYGRKHDLLRRTVVAVSRCRPFSYFHGIDDVVMMIPQPPHNSHLFLAFMLSSVHMSFNN
jgi:hypothetical protein